MDEWGENLIINILQKGGSAMVDQELLSAISDLLEEKLEQKLEEKLEQKLEQKLETKLESKLYPIRCDLVELKSDVSELQVDNRNLHAKMTSLEREVKKNSLILENDVLPRLQTIEQCYVESSGLFVKKSEQIDCLQADVDVMKIVIKEHSEILDKIS